MSDNTLRASIQDAMKTALREKDKARLATIRLILADIKRIEVDERIELDDTRTLAVLDKMRKQRRDSIEQYESAGRQELADIEAQEITVIESFMPSPLSDAEIDDIVTQTIADFTKIIPTSKIILGVPYYGYQWQTASNQFMAQTYFQTGALATYKRTQKLLHPEDQTNPSVLGLQTHWNDLTLTPWISFTDQFGRNQQIHYEDERSLGLKYDLVNQNNLGGIAIWALGYDGHHPQLWQLLEQKFLPQN